MFRQGLKPLLSHFMEAVADDESLAGAQNCVLLALCVIATSSASALPPGYLLLLDSRALTGHSLD